MTLTIQDVREELIGGGVVCDIGQITPDMQKQINKWLKSGQLSKWRGHWYPVAGASFGMGPLKNCYGLPEVHDSLNFKVPA